MTDRRSATQTDTPADPTAPTTYLEMLSAAARATPAPLRVPDGDLTLSDGRILRLTRRGPIRAGGEGILPSTGTGWRGPKDLTVVAAIEPAPHGQTLHVSVSYPAHYPSMSDMQKIRDAFFPPDRDAFFLLPRTELRGGRPANTLDLYELPVRWGVRS